MFDDLAPAQSVLLIYITSSLLGLILVILILWLIIRSATLSALRKHSAEERAHARTSRSGPPHDL